MKDLQLALSPATLFSVAFGGKADMTRTLPDDRFLTRIRPTLTSEWAALLRVCGPPRPYSPSSPAAPGYRAMDGGRSRMTAIPIGAPRQQPAPSPRSARE